MSVNEILAVDKLSPDELQVIQEKIDLRLHAEAEETPEMLAAIDEGLRSLREEGTIPLEDVIREIPTWNLKSP